MPDFIVESVSGPSVQKENAEGSSVVTTRSLFTAILRHVTTNRRFQVSWEAASYAKADLVAAAQAQFNAYKAAKNADEDTTITLT